VVDTASVIENTLKSAKESVATVKEITSDAGRASPETTKAIYHGLEIVKRETSHATGNMMKGFRHKSTSA